MIIDILLLNPRGVSVGKWTFYYTIIPSKKNTEKDERFVHLSAMVDLVPAAELRSTHSWRLYL